MEQDIKIWSKLPYSSTTYRNKTHLIVFNSEYSLFKKSSSTEYVGRFSPTVYSEVEWFVLKNFDERQDIKVSPENIALFYKVGKITNEDKKILKENFKLDVPKTERKKKEIINGKYVIFLEKDSFYGFIGCNKNVKYSKFISEDENSFSLITKEGEKKKFSKSKYYIKIVDEQIVKQSVETLNEEIKKYNESLNKANENKNSLIKKFK